jgi:hypothetical protein
MNTCPLLCLLHWLCLEKVSHTFMCMFMGKLLNILGLQQHASVEQERKKKKKKNWWAKSEANPNDTRENEHYPSMYILYINPI